MLGAILMLLGRGTANQIPGFGVAQVDGEIAGVVVDRLLPDPWVLSCPLIARAGQGRGGIDAGRRELAGGDAVVGGEVGARTSSAGIVFTNGCSCVRDR